MGFFWTFGNFGVFLRSILGGFRHTRGPFLSRLLGTTSWPFFIAAHRGGKRRTQQALDAAGIPYWGWGYHGGEFFFRVPKDRAWEAEEILMSNGTPMRGRSAYTGRKFGEG